MFTREDIEILDRLKLSAATVRKYRSADQNAALLMRLRERGRNWDGTKPKDNWGATTWPQ